MAEPKTKKAPETDAPEMPEAEKAPEPARAERSYADRMERELRLPRGGEGAVLITALLDLHRTVGAGASGPTIRGRKGEQSNRYLEAARRIGDQLVDDILGPADR